MVSGVATKAAKAKAAKGGAKGGLGKKKPKSAVVKCPVTVSIQARPCRLIPKGATRTFRAHGTPSGGTYSWTATGHVSIVGAANAATVNVKGDSTSAAFKDSELKVTYTFKGKKAEDTIKLTVVEIKKIKVTIKGTPGIPPGNAAQTAPADHTLESTLKAESFPPANSLILMRAAIQDVALEMEFAPPGIPIAWDVKRAPDDAAALKKRRRPTVAMKPLDHSKATLHPNATGSFFVRAFADCSGAGTFHKDDDFILLPLVLVEASLVRDNSATHTAHIGNPTVGGGSLGLSTGSFNIGSPNTEAIHMNCTADVLSGGPDGRRLLDRVFAGWINNESANENIRATYAGGHLRFTIFSTTKGSGPNGEFRPGDAAPAIVSPPLLDTGRGSPGTGGDTATLTRSRIKTKTNRPLGQRWIVESIDSPGDGAPLTHAAHGTHITNFHFELHFQAFLSFWTNRGGTSGATGDPADRVYSVLRSYNWDMLGDWNIDAANNVTAVTPIRVRRSGRTTHKLTLPEAHDAGCEVRAPTGLSLLTNDEVT
jgi:hypothetical protein